MAKNGRRNARSEVAIRGNAIYAEKVQPNLKKTDRGKFAVIDINTGEFEIAADPVKACHRLESRVANPRMWLVRIGARYLFSFGGHAIEEPA
jgi:hypothetical protein